MTDDYTKVADEFGVAREDVKFAAIAGLYGGLGGISLSVGDEDTITLIRKAVRTALAYGIIKRKDEPK